MPSWLPSVAYPPVPAPQSGYWHPITSTLNWCEEDYYATLYVAEIVNTLTNVLFWYLSYRGIKNCIEQKHDQVFLVTFIGYGIVGTGSFLFHATLKYPMQLVDELSMIYTTCLMCYATFSHARSLVFRAYLGIGLVALSVFITVYYHYLQDPTFHQNAYAVLTAVVLLRCMWIMESTLGPSWSPNEHSSRAGQSLALTNREILSTMWLMVAVGLSVFLGGFGIWTLDNKFCGTLIQWRREIGLPWGILLEGHGWWHLMTGTGAYFYIIWGIWLRHCLNGRQREYRLVWPSMFLSFPEIVRTDNEVGGINSSKKLK